jgi:glycosyltransferase involved in cell wall biosynthesis
MPKYVNPHPHVVNLTGPDGSPVAIRGGQSIELDIFFDRYVARGFLRRSNGDQQLPLTPHKAQTPISKPTPNHARKKLSIAHKISYNSPRRQKIRQKIDNGTKMLKIKGKLGAPISVDANNILLNNLPIGYPISNGIGIGITSFNRKASLNRLIDSIIRHTNLLRTTVFISDDGSEDPEIINYLEALKSNPNIIVIRNNHNLGVAGNSNRLLRCLSRFKFGILLNDDVEILNTGWEQFYVDASTATGFHHFIYREVGVYGAQLGQAKQCKNRLLRRVDSKPHGAVLFFTNEMFNKCGYFDESYGKYGLEHVDWSMKPAELGLQEPGFYDVAGSDQFFKIHRDNTSIPNKSEQLLNSRKLFEQREPGAVKSPSDDTKLPQISYVVPFRSNNSREESLSTIINGIRAQRFPVIDIILSEQDRSTKIITSDMMPARYVLATHQDPKFNKSRAFNAGVSLVRTDKVILHDADMLVTGDYTQRIFTVLENHAGCHMGGTVIYTTQEAASEIVANGVVDQNSKFDRVVGYYEGGSLACTTETYWGIGGFNEDFRGWGCEDCDFYARLSSLPTWYEKRDCDLVHLWHGRDVEWQIEHSSNQSIQTKLNAMSMADRINLQVAQSKINGYQ